jgi:hypothetical protein
MPNDDFLTGNQMVSNWMEDLERKWKLAIMALNKIAGAVPTLLPY